MDVDFDLDLEPDPLDTLEPLEAYDWDTPAVQQQTQLKFQLPQAQRQPQQQQAQRQPQQQQAGGKHSHAWEHASNASSSVASPSVVSSGGGTGAILNVSPGLDEQAFRQVRLDREREGQCAECGAHTHDVQFDRGGNRVKVPVTVPGEVHRGRCLFCHPLPAHQAATYAMFQDGANQNQVQGGETELERHMNRRQTGAHVSSSASVCTASSENSHSVYSHQSAPVGNVFGAGGQVLTQQQQQAQHHPTSPFHQSPGNGFVQNGGGHSKRASFSNDGLAPAYVENLRRKHSSRPQDDSGSVYSNSNTSVTSHQSHTSFQSFQQKGQQPQGDGGSQCGISSQSSTTPPEASAIENSLQQMQDEEADFVDVLSAMRRFPAHVLIQEKGCAILWVQSYNEEVKDAVGRMGGVETVIDAMRNHPNVNRLQRAGCEALRNLATSPVNRQFLSRAGGVPVIVETMRRHWDDPNVQRSGCASLASVADGSVDSKISVAECGGILAVMKAVESHPENEAVLRSAYQALRMLGYNPGARGGVGS